MAKFTLVNGGPEVTATSLRADAHKRVYLAGAGPDKNAVAVSSTNPGIVTASLVLPFDGSKGIWTVELVAKKIKGKAEVQAKVRGVVAARLTVKVVDRTDLPPASTEEGLLARLLLAENRTPDESGYDATHTKTSMQWMRLVLVNRLTNDPAQFAAPGAKSVEDIVKAKGQFEGFEDYPKLGSKVSGRLTDIVRIANDDGDPRQDRYEHFLQNALEVAKSTILITDPCPTKLYGWRTAGSAAPGGRFVPYDGPLSGNQFYTLKD